MKERQFLQLPLSAWEIIEELDDVQKGQLLSAAFQYDMKGSLPDFKGVLKVAFIVIRQYLDLCREHYEETCKRNSENGKKGGRPKKNNTESAQDSAVADKTQSDLYADEENESSEKRAVFFETEKSQNKINKNKLNYIKVSEKESKEKENAAFLESGNDNDTDGQTDLQTTKIKNISFGRSVKLTEEQYAELCGEYGASIVDEYIFKVDGYIDEKGCRPYGSQFSTIKRWIEEDRHRLAEKKAEEGTAKCYGYMVNTSGHSYDLQKMLDYAMTHIPVVKD